METVDQIYENLDKMQEMKRYKAPTAGYFPTAAEVNTYAHSEEFEYMIPYLMWLDECLKPSERAQHKEALDILRKIVAELDDKGEEDPVVKEADELDECYADVLEGNRDYMADEVYEDEEDVE